MQELTAAEVQTARAELKLSQAALAEALGTTTRNVQYWESGDRTAPKMLRLALAALRAGVTPWG